MDQDFIRFGLAAFVTLLVVVDPPGVVPIFVALTKEEKPAQQRRILLRAVLIACGVAFFFLLAGRAVLSYLGVTVHAFSISGGILLFGAALLPAVAAAVDRTGHGSMAVGDRAALLTGAMAAALATMLALGTRRKAPRAPAHT